MRILTSRRLAAAAITAALVLTGCSKTTGAASEEASAGGVDSAAVATSAENLDAMIDENAPAAPTGTLRQGHWLETLSMDPLGVTTHQGFHLMPVYDTLFQINSEFEPEPWLVTEWERPTDSSVRLTLRDDVTFHDGSEFNAETIKLNFERAKTFEGSPNANMYEPIESVDVLDDQTAVVNFSKPYPNFFYNMSTIAGAMVSPKAIEEDADLTRETAGSGGWIWQKDQHEEGSKHVYSANPDYWNPDAVKVETIETTIYTDTTARINAFSSGQIDIASYISAANFSDVEGEGSLLLSDYVVASSLVIFDREGEKVEAFGDPKVREAIGLLIDREGFNQTVFGGNGDPKPGGFAAPASKWYNSDLDQRQLDTEKALQLLEEAGYADGFEFDLPSTAATSQQSAGIQQMLAAGNITVNISDMQTAEYTASLRKGDFAAGYLVPTAVDIDQWWARSVSNEGPLNPFGLDDLADLETKYQDAAVLPDEERKPVMDELQAEVIDRGVMFPLSLQPTTSVANSETVKSTQRAYYAPEDHAPRPFYLWVQE